MTERRRNIAVGLTALIGLALLIVLILLFAGLPEMFQRGQTIVMHFNLAHDLHTGEPVRLRGMRVGVITDVSFTDGDPLKGVTVKARIKPGIRLPRNIRPTMNSKALSGSAYLTLDLVGPLPKDKNGNEITHFDPDEEVPLLEGAHDFGSGMIPKELVDAMESFGKLADNLNALLAPEPAPKPEPGKDETDKSAPPEPPAGLKGAIVRLNRTLDALYAITGSQENQENLQASLKNFAAATAKAVETMEAITKFAKKGGKTLDTTDELARTLITDAEEMGKLLRSIQKTADTLNTGEGTAGKFLHDPELYNNLVGVSEKMDALIQDFRRLAEKWEKEGLGIKLK